MIKQLVVFSALTLCLVACHPKVDASSPTSLLTSVAKVRLALDASKRDEFDAALLKVTFGGVRDASLLDLAKHADAIVPEAKAAIDGKTAAQIMARAGQLGRRK